MKGRTTTATDLYFPTNSIFFLSTERAFENRTIFFYHQREIADGQVIREPLFYTSVPRIFGIWNVRYNHAFN